MWTHVVGYGPKIFADDARYPSLLQHDAQILLAFAPIGFAILQGFVIPRCEVRRTPASSFEHLIPIEWKGLFVLSRPPGKRVDAIKSEDVIDAKKVKNSPDGTHPFAPPIEIASPHYVPAIKRNAPVLSPFLGE